MANDAQAPDGRAAHDLLERILEDWPHTPPTIAWKWLTEALARARAEEREACAEIIESGPFWGYAEKAARIRARRAPEEVASPKACERGQK